MNPSIVDISPVLSQIAINETKLPSVRSAAAMSGNGQHTVSKLCHQFAWQSPQRQRVITVLATSCS